MTEIAKIIRQQVQEQGVLPFSEFMRLALYCPKYGYYEQAGSQIGRKGDFFTSVSTGSLFGELLAFQFFEWLGELNPKPRKSPHARSDEPYPRSELRRSAEAAGGEGFQLVEAGAHGGQLAADILNWFQQNQPAFLSSLEYWIIEPSPQRRSWQKDKLEHFPRNVRWVESPAMLPPKGITGIIFSNELFDAMPVRRLGWDAAGSR